jgi:hypothetical protein
MKKFKESLDTAVFTTQYVIESKSVIVYVCHDDDGDWQFHGAEDDISEDEMRVVGLGEIITLDNTILDISDLPIGFEAIRKDINSPWTIISPN